MATLTHCYSIMVHQGVKSQTFPHYFLLWILRNFDNSNSIQHVLPHKNFSFLLCDNARTSKKKQLPKINYHKQVWLESKISTRPLQLMTVFNSLEEAGWKLCSHIHIIFTNRKLHVLKIRLPNSKLHYCLQIYNERLFLKIINNFYL